MILCSGGALPITLAAAFAAGVAGSVHCAAMCGGVAGALGMQARRLGASSAQAFAHAVYQQVGRVSSYCAAGALCGAFGGALAELFDLERVALAVRMLAGALLIVVSLRVLFGWRLPGGLERVGAHLWSRIAPAARGLPSRGPAGSLLMGALWGWLPCGLVYSMLVFATLSGSAGQGAARMLLFGLGTWPAMLAGSLLSAQVWKFAVARRLNAVAGALLLAFGIATAVGPLLQL